MVALALTLWVVSASAATPLRVLLLEAPGPARASELLLVLRANTSDLAIRISLGTQPGPAEGPASETEAVDRLGKAAGVDLVLWVRETASPEGRSITLFLADRLPHKTVIRHVTMVAALNEPDLLRLIALKARGLLRASLLEREESGAVSAPAPASAPVPPPGRSSPAAPRARMLMLEAAGRVAGYPGAAGAEYGAGVVLRAGRGAWRLAAAVDVMRQHAHRDADRASLTHVLPTAGLEHVRRAGPVEGWAGIQAGVVWAQVEAAGPDVVVTSDSRVRGVIGASLGSALRRGWFRLAAELGLQGIPGGHRYSIHGAEVVGVASVRLWGGLSVGAAW